MTYLRTCSHPLPWKSIKALLYSDQDTVESAAEAQLGKSQRLAKAIFEVEIYSPKMVLLILALEGEFPRVYPHPPPPQPCYTLFQSPIVIHYCHTVHYYYIIWCLLLVAKQLLINDYGITISDYITQTYKTNVSNKLERQNSNLLNDEFRYGISD